MLSNERSGRNGGVTKFLLAALVLVVIGWVVSVRVTGRYTRWQIAKMPDDKLAASAAKPDASFAFVAAWAHRLEANARFAEAARVYGRAMEMQPTDAEAWCGYGRTAFAAGDWQRAEPELRKTVEQWPDRADIRFVFAGLLASTFRLHSAIQEMQTALKNDHDNGAAWLTLGELQMRVGDSTSAVTAYARAKTLLPKVQKVHSYYGAALLSAGKYKQAQAELEVALTEDPSSINARFDMGKALAYGASPQDRPRAMQELNRVVKFSANKSRAYMEAGRIWLRDGERGNAIQDFEQAYQLNKTNIDMLKLLIQAYRADGRHVEAEKVGQDLARSQKLTDARAVILADLDSNKSVVANLISLGRIDRQLDNPIEANSAFDAALHLDPHSADAARELKAKPVR